MQSFAPAATLPTLVYLWQLPHFYGLAYASKEDYARGGFRMLPTVDADGRKTFGAMARASAGAWQTKMISLCDQNTFAAGLPVSSE